MVSVLRSYHVGVCGVLEQMATRFASLQLQLPVASAAPTAKPRSSRKCSKRARSKVVARAAPPQEALLGSLKELQSLVSPKVEQSPRSRAKSTAEEVMDGISLDSKVVLITGGSAGIGFETSRVLARRGAHVVIASENLKAAHAAKLKILEQTPNAQVTVLHLNLGSMYSVRNFVAKFKALGLPLHILINNAGIASSQFVLSEDGLEMTFAVNHVGHFVLTHSLLDLIEETATQSGNRGRIVVVASSQHESARGINFKNLHRKSWMFAVPVLQSIHGLSTVYAQTKLANILFAKELARRLEEQGVNISVNALHPGVFNSSFVEKFAEPAGLAFSWIEPFLKTIEQGAATTCYVAAHPDVEGISGKYFADCQETSGSKYASDMELGKELWAYTEDLIASHANLEDCHLPS
ncbi:short-chain dehydrogenase TIC 32, chloroplastic [Selaginella moellendorffii]|uniref:short-chain dehydrogenase TIC 32, chloroplastic n=1 Tax=Selaginella moellendorffii TaxID=88036 RepID=UPI000D1CBF4E|nr:short-chain dehydrogenase TIC 32, chloroplastic [Selaginella moellendorffii]|eukprot:XP_024515874.1 short-chain dehydrogenase TIC 32, chloroplastic [Selaginella moellendorffii]